ncbi:MAG: class I SAM-dependent methyltransferase [Proteobacteria bacterium]|nr:class I SAM-dependent methyltransferase [Pseudomonadota bacterium]
MSTGGSPTFRDRIHGRSIEAWILRRIFNALFSSDRDQIVFTGDSEKDKTAIFLKLPNLYRAGQILFKPDIMLGQSYVNGYWAVQPERLYDFLYLIRSQESSRLQKWFLISNRFHIVRDALKQRVFPIRSTRAVVEHYNTDPEFISLILGPSLCYTCAFFENEANSLEDAQKNKLKLISARLSIREGHSVLDLGTGWGYAAFPLAEMYSCDVTGITISDAQVAFCNHRKQKSPAIQRLQFINADFAKYEPTFKFDRVISIGMLEHVGKYQYKLFFDKIANFMNRDGIALVHSMIDECETSTDAWIDKNIFPGGYIPTISEVVSGIEQSNCQLISLFSHDKSNYFATLERWKNNLFSNRIQCETALKRRGISNSDVTKIIRIWEYFLSSSQVAFSHKYGQIRVAHFVVKRKNE